MLRIYAMQKESEATPSMMASRLVSRSSRPLELQRFVPPRLRATAYRQVPLPGGTGKIRSMVRDHDILQTLLFLTIRWGPLKQKAQSNVPYVWDHLHGDNGDPQTQHSAAPPTKPLRTNLSSCKFSSLSRKAG